MATPPTLESVTACAELEISRDRVDHYLAASLSEATRRQYRGAWSRFVAWAQLAGLDPLDVGGDAFAGRLSQLADAGASCSTVGVECAAVALAYRAVGRTSPTEAPIVRRVLRGIRRSRADRPIREARPVGLIEIGAMLTKLRPGPIGVRDRAIVLLGYALAARRSELAALNMADVERRPEGLLITIRRSKTDQVAKTVVLGVPLGRRPELCPVLAFDAWSVTRQDQASPSCDAVFCALDRAAHGHRLSGRSVAKVVQALARAVALSGVSGHSLRAGMVTDAAGAGIAEATIFRHSRHDSIATGRRYIRRGGAFRDNPLSSLL